jgi:hypothetical protein
MEGHINVFEMLGMSRPSAEERPGRFIAEDFMEDMITPGQACDFSNLEDRQLVSEDLCGSGPFKLPVHPHCRGASLEKSDLRVCQDDNGDLEDVVIVKAEIQKILAAIDEGERRIKVLTSFGRSPPSQRLIDNIHDLRKKALVTWVKLTELEGGFGLDHCEAITF